MASPKLCKVEECDNPFYAKGFCSIHYKRMRIHGDPLVGGPPRCRGKALEFFHNIVLTYDGDDCFIWPFTRIDKGYAKLWHEGRYVSVSRLVCEQIYGPAPSPKHEAAHNCGKGHEGCVNPRHLRWATSKENCDDKIIHGTHGRKLTEADARAIRQMPGTLREVSAMFSVDESTVSLIKRRKRWKHV